MSSNPNPSRSRGRIPPETPRGGGPISRRVVERISTGGASPVRRRVRDVLATEEPLEIALAGAAGPEPLTVTMRTPGADFDLVAGFLFAEGIVSGAGDLVAMRHCSGLSRRAVAETAGGNGPFHNRVEVRLARARANPSGRARSFYTSSSCGVCGSASIDAVMSLECPPVGEGPRIGSEVLLSLPGRLRQAQSIFERTGGLHAAGLFDAGGSLLCIREDVGRHNAMDKLVGASLLAGAVPLRGRIVLLSGRLSFELVQKAARAGVAVLAGVSAPSTLAVELAERAGITLVGFLRETGFNIYAGGERIDSAAAPDVRL